MCISEFSDKMKITIGKMLAVVGNPDPHLDAGYLLFVCGCWAQICCVGKNLVNPSREGGRETKNFWYFDFRWVWVHHLDTFCFFCQGVVFLCNRFTRKFHYSFMVMVQRTIGKIWWGWPRILVSKHDFSIFCGGLSFSNKEDRMLGFNNFITIGLTW